MKNTINIDIFDGKSINRALKQLDKYEKQLEKKCKTFVERLQKEGIDAISARVSSISPVYREDETGSVYVKGGELEKTANGWHTSIVMGGGQAVFIEFGAGNVLNTAPGGSKHPLGVEEGMTIGSYPGQTHVPTPGYWFYKDQFGNKQFTYGTPTFAPMFHGYEELMQKINEIAKEVFNG